MNEPRSERPSLAPAAELLGEALALYGRNAPVLIGIAIAAALVGNLTGLLASPSATVIFILWNQFVAALITGFQAPVWLLAALARRGEPFTAGAVLYGLVSLMPRFFAVGFLLGLGGGGLLLFAIYVPAFSLPALPVLIFFAVRFSLAGPAIVLEQRPPLQALARSWQLVGGNWWRTFVVQLPVLVFAIMLVLIGGAVASWVEADIVAVVVGALALGAGAPLIALVETALFEEYSGRQPPAIEEGTVE